MDNYWDGEHTVGARWLKKVLKDVNKDNIIVSFGHEPAFTCNTFHPNYYFRGHTHQYNLCTITHNGKIIHLIVSGGGEDSFSQNVAVLKMLTDIMLNR